LPAPIPFIGVRKRRRAKGSFKAGTGCESVGFF